MVKKVVMIVDDNEIDIMIHEKIVSSVESTLGTLSFNNARKAIDYLSQLPESFPFPELIILDLNMPKMNGFDFIIHYNKLSHPSKDITKIMVLSNSATQQQIEKLLLNKNIYGCYQKPLNVSLIRKIYTELLTENKKPA